MKCSFVFIARGSSLLRGLGLPFLVSISDIFLVTTPTAAASPRLSFCCCWCCFCCTSGGHFLSKKLSGRCTPMLKGFGPSKARLAAFIVLFLYSSNSSVNDRLLLPWHRSRSLLIRSCRYMRVRSFRGTSRFASIYSRRTASGESGG